MARMELEREIKYKTYRTRKDISTYEELLKAIITYQEVFYCIFRNAANPIIEIKAYNPETKESLIFEIDAKYQRHTASYIKRKYIQLVKQNNFLKDINNIADVNFITKGTKYRKQTIYSNADTPWRNSIFD